MPVGNITLTSLHPVAGVKIGVAQAHVRYPNRKDLVIFELAQNSQVTAVTTTNAFCAAPVQLVRHHLKQTTAPAYLLINTGNANAGTGADGLARAKATCDALAKLGNVEPEQVLPYSTGVIGEPLPSDKIISGLPAALAEMAEDNWLAAAHGIMTTDTTPKGASEKITCDDVTYTITGISKGAGMIRPNMATMLGFIATDANIAPSLLANINKQLADLSFNRITIDGDTSTNDCCTLIATGLATADCIDDENHPHYPALLAALRRIYLRIAELIVRDGEGATKFMTIQVTGGNTSDECAKVAYAVAHSPLVKTAFFASDPNWGRILAAVGYAGVSNLDVSQINVHLDEVQICQGGGLAADYREEKGQVVMQRPEITIHIDLGRGDASDTVYTCDLSYDYVKINADYRS